MMLHVHKEATDSLKMAGVANDFVSCNESRLTLFGKLKTSVTKTPGLEWNTTMDHFRLAVTNLSSPEGITKRMLVSNVAKVFDVLGWFSPTIIKVKILLQRLWQAKLE